MPCVNPSYYLKCNAIGTLCVQGNSNEGCEHNAGSPCQNCYRGYGEDPPPEEGGNKVTTTSLREPYVGYMPFKPSSLGYLAEEFPDLELEDEWLAINREPLRSVEDVYRRRKIESLFVYRPSNGQYYVFEKIK